MFNKLAADLLQTAQETAKLFKPIEGTSKATNIMGTIRDATNLPGFKTFSIGGKDITTSSKISDSLMNADRDMFGATGQHLSINSAYRSNAQQQEIWNRSRGGTLFQAARPGHSNHEFGTAVDIGNWQAASPYLSRYGLINKLPNDRVHFSLTGH